MGQPLRYCERFNVAALHTAASTQPTAAESLASKMTKTKTQRPTDRWRCNCGAVLPPGTRNVDLSCPYCGEQEHAQRGWRRILGTVRDTTAAERYVERIAREHALFKPFDVEQVTLDLETSEATAMVVLAAEVYALRCELEIERDNNTKVAEQNDELEQQLQLFVSSSVTAALAPHAEPPDPTVARRVARAAWLASSTKAKVGE